jgi:hypothetical protein
VDGRCNCVLVTAHTSQPVPCDHNKRPQRERNTHR